MEGILYHEECLMRLARKGKLTKKVDGHTISMVPSISNFRMIKGGVKVLKICKATTKLFEKEKSPTLSLVVERLYNMDKELEYFIDDVENKEEDNMAVDFANVLRGKLQERFPEFGTDREINCIANYLNPSIKGIHLRLTKKLLDTKATMEEKLKAWKKTEALEETVLDEDIEEVATNPAPAKVMSPTDLLKKQLKEATVADQGQNGRKRIRNTTMSYT